MRSTIRTIAAAALLAAPAAVPAAVPPPSAHWEDLTSADFVRSLAAAGGVCILPMASVEKFGPSAPLGTNLYVLRDIVDAAVGQEPAVVFPADYVANTSDTSNLPGTIHYSIDLQLRMLDETTREMARNGCRKIVLANGHTGNLPLIGLYMANLTTTAHDFVVYTTYPSGFPVNDWSQAPAAARPSRPGADGHGGEERVAALLALHPDLVHLDRAHDEPASPGHGGDDPAHAPPQGMMASLSTGYSGDASGATAMRGRALIAFAAGRFVQFLRGVKADAATPEVQRSFYQRVQHPQN